MKTLGEQAHEASSVVRLIDAAGREGYARGIAEERARCLDNLTREQSTWGTGNTDLHQALDNVRTLMTMGKRWSDIFGSDGEPLPAAAREEGA